MRNFINEFKKFAMRGNVIDMAVGIIIGAAFGKIVDSLVKDILMPPIGILMGKIDFANLFFVLMDGTVPGPYASLEVAQNAGAVTMNVGIFLNALISFVIVAFAVFLLIKAINTLQEKMLAAEKKEEAAAPTTKKCPYCCSEIPLEATRCPHCTSELK
jgi:large conductance mechanosensitive channel